MWIGDEPDAGEPGARRRGHHSGNVLVGDLAVRANVNFGLRPESRGRVEACAYRFEIGWLAVPMQRAVRADRELDVLARREVFVRARLGQIDLHRMREQRCGDDEDHEQHEHHVDQRDDVDLRERTLRPLSSEAAEGHHVLRLATGVAGGCATAPPPAAASRSPVGEKREEIVSEAVELREHEPVRAREGVVAEHPGDGDGEAEGGHDQRLADRAGDLIERALAAQSDRDERVVHAPHGAEQPDERRGRSDRGEQRQPALQARRLLVDRAAHRAGEEVGKVTRVREALAAVRAKVRDGREAALGEPREGIAGGRAHEVVGHCGERRRVPEEVVEPRGGAPLEEPFQCLDEDEVPGRDRHRDEDREHALAHRIGLREEVGEAEAAVHGSVRTENEVERLERDRADRDAVAARRRAAPGPHRRERCLVEGSGAGARGDCRVDDSPDSSSSTRSTTRPSSRARRAARG